MLSFIIGSYKIEVSDMTANYLDFLDGFDNVYIDNEEYISSVIAVKLYKEDALIKATLIGGTGGHMAVQKSSIIIDNDIVIGCCSDNIFCLSIPQLQLSWKTKVDEVTCFQIFKYKADYIVHGELQISRIDADGKIIWQQTGGDVFVNDFIITDKFISAVDWNYHKYKIDFDGNIIE